MSIPRWTIPLVLAVAAVALIANFPAAVAYRWFVPNELQLFGVEGTLWEGSAALGSTAGVPFHDVDWELRPLSLVLGRLDADLKAKLSDGFVDGRVKAGLSSLKAENLRVSTTLANFQEWLLYPADGQISLDLTEVTVKDGWPTRLIGTTRIANLRVLVPPVENESIGSFKIDWATNDYPSGSVSDTGGLLETNGKLDLLNDQRYVLDAAVAARPGAPRALSQGLQFMLSPPDDAGQQRLRWEGTIN